MPKINPLPMTGEQIKQIRLDAGFSSREEFAAEIGKSKRWLDYRETDNIELNKMETLAMLEIKRSHTLRKNKLKKRK